MLSSINTSTLLHSVLISATFMDLLERICYLKDATCGIDRQLFRVWQTASKSLSRAFCPSSRISQNVQFLPLQYTSMSEFVLFKLLYVEVTKKIHILLLIDFFLSFRSSSAQILACVTKSQSFQVVRVQSRFFLL